MSEKISGLTPRELSDAAEMFRSRSEEAERDVIVASSRVKGLKDQAEYFGRVAAGEDRKNLMAENERWADYAPVTPEKALKFSRSALEALVEAQPAVYQREAESAKYAQQAKGHFDRHAAGYHDLAILEAAMDEVHINAEKPEAVKEHPEND